jgi:hypothetical protein
MKVMNVNESKDCELSEEARITIEAVNQIQGSE